MPSQKRSEIPIDKKCKKMTIPNDKRVTNVNGTWQKKTTKEHDKSQWQNMTKKCSDTELADKCESMDGKATRSVAECLYRRGLTHLIVLKLFLNLFRCHLQALAKGGRVVTRAAGWKRFLSTVFLPFIWSLPPANIPSVQRKKSPPPALGCPCEPALRHPQQE